ncbi:MAG TPA: DUF2269 family protein [Candidatus Tumulicola sp.]|nr:DUF2269 family protein [Candidatus Tumulicola sp.]
MPTAYLALKVVHILLVAAALGSNFTYGVWFARANAHPGFAATALRGIKFIDDWIANPAYVLLLPTGAAMAYIGGLSFRVHWIEWAMGLWAIAILAGFFGYSPTLRAQIHAVDRAGVDSEAAKELAVRGQIWAAFLGVVVLAIVVLMVFKPA